MVHIFPSSSHIFMLPSFLLSASWLLAVCFVHVPAAGLPVSLLSKFGFSASLHDVFYSLGSSQLPTRPPLQGISS
jgi:hypothetical protein